MVPEGIAAARAWCEKATALVEKSHFAKNRVPDFIGYLTALSRGSDSYELAKYVLVHVGRPNPSARSIGKLLQIASSQKTA